MPIRGNVLDVRAISSDDAAGPPLPTNAVSTTQHILGSNHLLGTMQLVLTPV